MTEYLRSGKNGAPTLLFLHGWGSNAAVFKGLIDNLEKDFDVVALNFPGFSGTDQPPQVWDVQDYADWTEKFIEKAGLKEIHAIVGHSFGGRVMLKGISNSKFRAEKLIFMDTSGVKPRLDTRGKTIKLMARMSRILPSSLRAKVGQKFASTDYKNLQGDPIMRQTFQNIVNEDLTSAMPLVKQPSLLIWGADDTETPPADAKVFATKILHSQLEIIDQAGHYVFLDQPEKVLKLIKEFL